MSDLPADDHSQDPDPAAATGSGAAAASTPGVPAAPTHPRWLLPVLGAGIVTLIIAANLGNVMWARWADADSGHPLWLLALNSSNRYLLLTSIITSAPPYLLVAMSRLLAPDPLFYLLGYIYRDRALHWARQVFPGMDGLFDLFEQDRNGFKRLLDVAVLIAPNNPVCLLAGVAAMPIRRFIALNLVGTLGRVLLMRTLGLIFEDEIRDLLEIVSRYQRWLTWGSLAAVGGYLVWQVVNNRGLVGGVESLDDELGDD